MKTVLIITLFICCSMLAGIMPARTTDENIDLLYNSGDFYKCMGETFFVADYINGDVYPDKSEALQYLAEAGYLFAIIQGDIESYTYTDNIQYMKYVRYIGCPYTDQNTSGIAYVSTFYFKEVFVHQFEPDITTEDLIKERLKLCNEVVTKWGSTMSFDYWNEN
jgi:hypothetical protein